MFFLFINTTFSLTHYKYYWFHELTLYFHGRGAVSQKYAPEYLRLESLIEPDV